MQYVASNIGKIALGLGLGFVMQNVASNIYKGYIGHTPTTTNRP